MSAKGEVFTLDIIIREYDAPDGDFGTRFWKCWNVERIHGPIGEHQYIDRSLVDYLFFNDADRRDNIDEFDSLPIDEPLRVKVELEHEWGDESVGQYLDTFSVLSVELVCSLKEPSESEMYGDLQRGHL